MRNINIRRRGWLSLIAGSLAVLAPGAAMPVFAQSGVPDDALMLSDSLAVSPSIGLVDAGWDDNVFYMSEEDGPLGDFVATLSPAVRAWLRGSRLRITGRSEADLIYFKRYSHLRSIDSMNDGRVELLLGRFKPSVGGAWASTRHQRNLEILVPIRRVDSSWDAGLDFQLSPKTTIGVTTRQLREDYKGDTVYLDTDLASALEATVTVRGVKFRYAWTPLTTVGADVEEDRTDFPKVPDRNSDGVRVMSFVEFQPLAVVSGRVQVGVRTRTFVDGAVAPFKGTVANIVLNYTLLGRTRFAVRAERDLSHSYRADARDYLLSGFELSVTHRPTDTWDIGGAAGRFDLSYAGTQPPDERVRNYALEVGCRIGKTRVGVRAARQTRSSDATGGRTYEQNRIGSSVSYAF